MGTIVVACFYWLTVY